MGDGKILRFRGFCSSRSSLDHYQASNHGQHFLLPREEHDRPPRDSGLQRSDRARRPGNIDSISLTIIRMKQTSRFLYVRLLALSSRLVHGRFHYSDSARFLRWLVFRLKMENIRDPVLADWRLLSRHVLLVPSFDDVFWFPLGFCSI